MPQHTVVLIGTTKGAFFFHSDAARRDGASTSTTSRSGSVRTC